VLEVYGETLVIHQYAPDAPEADAVIDAAEGAVLERLAWITSVLHKVREAGAQSRRNGVLRRGTALATRITENGVHYALDLQLNRDASFYLDTRALRAWAKEHLGGKRVLNCFAYTGSLGVAALAGGAARVIQTDRSREFLAVAKKSAALNGLSPPERDLRAADFFELVGQLKRDQRLFDCIILDPPFFSTARQGTVAVSDIEKLINKARPLVAHEGFLVVVNNGLYVSGQELMAALERTCVGGFVSIETILPVADDCVGYGASALAPTNPAPFNHSTKIAVLRVRRKDEKR
jgi:23S rRNA (cytosine1962-C5)-methyltransferase